MSGRTSGLSKSKFTWIERWDDLVGWSLNINFNEVYRRANGDVTRDDPAPEIPVLIRYYTRLPDSSGRVRTYPAAVG